MSRSWPGHTPFTVAAVPTGRKAGVRKEPRSVPITPARASVPPSRASTANRTVMSAERGTILPPPSKDEHRVAVAVEPVPFRHRRAVRGAHGIHPRERHHQGEEARTGQVEVREERIHRAEPVPGKDELPGDP